MAKKPDLTRFLLEVGANVDLEENDEGPLLVSIRYKQEGLLSDLIDRGADVNAYGWLYNGQSAFIPLSVIPLKMLVGKPLQEAIQRNNEEAFHILLEKGVNVNQRGSSHGW
jgi:hypothetical protein